MENKIMENKIMENKIIENEIIFCIWLGNKIKQEYLINMNRTMSEIFIKNKHFKFIFYTDNEIKMISSILTCKYELFFIKNHVEIKNIYDSLECGGIFFVYVPAVPWIYSSMDQLVGHYRRYTKDELVLKLKSAGFCIKRSEYVDFLGVWLCKRNTILLVDLNIYVLDGFIKRSLIIIQKPKIILKQQLKLILYILIHIFIYQLSILI
jgi:hypothetical protein